MSLRLFILLVILAMNGFFAAAEVSLLTVRQSRLRELAEQGQSAAQIALNLLANPGRLLSATQVGVTIASLGLGWAGEDTVYHLMLRLVSPQIAIPSVLLHGVAFAIAFTAISYAHIVIGEVVPKNLAIANADRAALIAAPLLLIFYRVVSPFIFVVESSSKLILRTMGIATGHARGSHSVEELKFVIESSRRGGHLDQFAQEAIEHLIELADHSAREIMTPRNNIVSLPVDASLEDTLALFAEHKYTRVPVYEDRPEVIIGIVHYKDLLRLGEDRRFSHEPRRSAKPFRLRRFLRKPLVVPETKPLEQLIDEFRTSHTHMALVVDEFGTISGLVTLEDVLEQVFGDIGDEHDVIRPVPKPGEERVLQLDGTTTIRDLETRYSIELPSGAGFETLAGFILYRLGYIPKVADSVDFGSRRFTVTAMENNRIATVLVEKVEPQPEADPANEG